MAWDQISITVPHEFVEPISHVFERYGHGVGIQSLNKLDAEITTFLPSGSDSRLARIEIGVNLAKSITSMGDLQISPLDNETDWRNAWKDHFSVLHITDRIVIKPSWIEYVANESELIIEIDPGFAFGTGYHPTTHSCLALLETHITQGAEILDLGTGSGILSIAAAKLGAANVLGLDIDPLCVKAANNNAKTCGVTSITQFITGSLPSEKIHHNNYDCVVANISSRIGIEKSVDILEVLKPSGILILSGIINNQALSTINHFESIAIVENHYWKDDWVTFLIRKQETQDENNE